MYFEFSGFLVFIWCFLSFVGNIMNNLLFWVHLRAKFKYNSSLLSNRVSISNLINQRCSWWSLHWSVDFAIYIKMPSEAKVTDTGARSQTLVRGGQQHGRHLHSGALASLFAFRDHMGEVTNMLVLGSTAEDSSSLTPGMHSFSSWATQAAKTTVPTVWSFRDLC